MRLVWVTSSMMPTVNPLRGVLDAASSNTAFTIAGVNSLLLSP